LNVKYGPGIAARTPAKGWPLCVRFQRGPKNWKNHPKPGAGATPEAGQGGGDRPRSRLSLLFQRHPPAPLTAFISSRNRKINTIEDHSSISLDRSTGVFIKAILTLLDTQLWMGQTAKIKPRRGKKRAEEQCPLPARN